MLVDLNWTVGLIINSINNLGLAWPIPSNLIKHSFSKNEKIAKKHPNYGVGYNHTPKLSI